MLGAIFKITKPGHVVFALLFVGVPTTVSLSSFLSLIRLRLLTDPERTNSPHFAKKKKKNHKHIFYPYGRAPLSLWHVDVLQTTSWE